MGRSRSGELWDPMIGILNPHSNGTELKCWRFDKVYNQHSTNADVFRDVEGLVT